MSENIQIPDKLAWQKNRRRLAYLAMLTMIITIIASFIWPEKAQGVPAVDVLWISLCAIIMAFFGADALVSKGK